MAAPDHLQLGDGRRLDIGASGPAGGLPLVFHHGTPGSRLPFRALERAAHARELRFVTISRPGYGDSTPLPGREVADIVADTAAALDALAIDRCLVAGWSGGGPHALACAARLPSAAAALIIAGVAPHAAPDLDWLAGMGEESLVEFAAALAGEGPLRAYLHGVRDHLRSVTADGIIDTFESLLPEVDRAVLTDEFAEDMVANFHEGLRCGIEGWLADDLAFVRPWGFELDDISVPVLIWQGSEDLMTPFAHGQWLASHIPGATAHVEAGEGHLSISVGAIDRMLDELAAAV
jgi:pimeloyl-ACP methyl ester carboxylesterase